MQVSLSDTVPCIYIINVIYYSHVILTIRANEHTFTPVMSQVVHCYLCRYKHYLYTIPMKIFVVILLRLVSRSDLNSACIKF